MKTARHFFLFFLFAAHGALAADEVILNAAQVKSLGIATAMLPGRQQGELAGMPAQVVIPSNQMHVISATLPATVEQVEAGVGDHVGKGQVLARLQSPALLEAQRGFLQAHAQARFAGDTLSRDKQLWEEGIIAESRYRSAQSQDAQARAALAERQQMLRLSGMTDAAISRLKSGGNLASLLEVTSPMEGIVLERSISAGQRLDAAAPLFKVGRTKPLALEIQVPLSMSGDLAVGAAVNVPAYGAKGRLIAIGSSLSGANQTILLRAIISEGSENLRPGQYVEVGIATARAASSQWDIPNSAISRIEGRALVFVETAKGFRAVNVNVLHEGERNSVVTGKLEGSEKIAVRGVSALKSSLTGASTGD